ncbi:MAG: hypothetical protein ACR2OO_08445 [Thermomicrobiales bacterium]
MSESIPVDVFRGGIMAMFEELFEQVRGYVLDPGTSLFETLADVTAEEASRPVSPGGACLAAQVNHVRFYMDAVGERARSGVEQPSDWEASWRVCPVSDEEWRGLIARLRVTLADTREFVQTWEHWDARFVGGAFALVAHCAYHLGEIRQGLGVLRG